MVNPDNVHQARFFRNETSLYMNPTINNDYFTIFTYKSFLTVRKHLVLFLETQKFVDMFLNLRDEFMQGKEACTNLFARLTNFLKWHTLACYSLYSKMSLSLTFSLLQNFRRQQWNCPQWSFQVNISAVSLPARKMPQVNTYKFLKDSCKAQIQICKKYRTKSTRV